jgi:hypothetical protein
MEVTVSDEHLAALAERLKCEATCELSAGLETVMSAKAGAAVAAIRQRAAAAFPGRFMADLQLRGMYSLRVCTYSKHSGVLERI